MNSSSSSSSTLERIVHLNNTGVFYLVAADNEHGKAMGHLRESLTLLQSLLTSLPPTSNSVTSSDDNSWIASKSTTALVETTPESSSQQRPSFSIEEEEVPSNLDSSDGGICSFHLPLSSSLQELQQSDSKAFIYSRPFVFNNNNYNNNLSSSSDLGRCIHVNSAVVIFNMALSYHHRTVKNSSSSPLSSSSSQRRPFLQKAILLYDMCLELLLWSNAILHLKRAGLVLIMAALNNSSQLLLEVGDGAAARDKLDVLSSIAKTFLQRETLSSSLHEDEITGFLLNIIFASQHHAMSACAA